jgi:transcriptional regulator with XRE-family HTH domain
VSSLSNEARYLIRDIVALPERERIAIFEELRKDLAGQIGPSTSDDLNVERANAIETFNKVAKYLGYEDELLATRMTMEEFDKAPSRVRDGAKARQVARVFLNSWPLAKLAATGGILPVDLLTQRKRSKIAFQQRVSARHQTGLYEWLESDPDDESQAAYDRWRTERNKRLDEDERPFVKAKQIRVRFQKPWEEIIEEAKAGALVHPDALKDEPEEILKAQFEPGEDLEALLAGSAKSQRIYDLNLIARRLHAARSELKISLNELARRADLSPSTVADIERGVSSLVSFYALLKLATTLNVTLDYFATPDGGRGLPSAKKTKNTRTKAAAKRKSAKRGRKKSA